MYQFYIGVAVQLKKTTVDGELTVGKTKFVPMTTASEGLNIVILD